MSAPSANSREQLGTKGQPDAGFDLEVWNEMTFGSRFLDINNYYDPNLQFKTPLQYRGTSGREASGVEAILPMTIDYVTDPASGFPSVRVTSGFASQPPWDNGTSAWPGLFVNSKHYYTGQSVKELSPKNPIFGNTSGPLRLDGKPDGKPDGKDWHTIIPGSAFIPTQRISFPEFPFTAYKTEDLTRDVQPWPRNDAKYVGVHGRYSHPGTGKPPVIWQTEYNFGHDQFIPWIAAQANVKTDDPKIETLVHVPTPGRKCSESADLNV